MRNGFSNKFSGAAAAGPHSDPPAERFPFPVSSAGGSRQTQNCPNQCRCPGVGNWVHREWGWRCSGEEAIFEEICSYLTIVIHPKPFPPPSPSSASSYSSVFFCLCSWTEMRDRGWVSRQPPLLLLSTATNVISLISLRCTPEGRGRKGAQPRLPSTCPPGRLHCPRGATWLLPPLGAETSTQRGARLGREAGGVGDRKKLGDVPAPEKPLSEPPSPEFWGVLMRNRSFLGERRS